ncbi:MAG TPA: hypothetical protein VHX65_04075 [Pirellulales bacterium]|nr:hypothetical protein [Pirellulales bacterium]
MKERLYNFIAWQVLDEIPFEHATEAVELIVDKCKGKRQIAFNQYMVGQLKGRLDPRGSLRI